MKVGLRALIMIPALVYSGCSPFGRKSEPKELFPSDSLSRRIAESVTPESPVLNWRRDGGEGAYFSSIVLGTDGTLWVGDLGRNAIRHFTRGGEELEAIGGFSFPYLTGDSDDTIAVYDAGTNRMVSVADPTKGFALPPLVGESVGLARQAALVDGVTYVKDAHPPVAVVYGLDGSDVDPLRIELPGPAWHHYGVLRAWGDRLISASSYRPVLIIVDPAGRVDSLRLEGFDSPMLARSRAYAFGKVDEPPLMISGLFGTSNALYVINVRPGILRIDVFDVDAHLTRVLQREETVPSGFTPFDLVVQTEGDSTYVFVASVNTVYGRLSLQYASRLDRLAFETLE